MTPDTNEYQNDTRYDLNCDLPLYLPPLYPPIFNWYRLIILENYIVGSGCKVGGCKVRFNELNANQICTLQRLVLVYI